tara:strand:- start:408 stop:932 length:525 start_codon:yes stop_codon:yes gene_type:complete
MPEKPKEKPEPIFSIITNDDRDSIAQLLNIISKEGFDEIDSSDIDSHIFVLNKNGGVGIKTEANGKLVGVCLAPVNPTRNFISLELIAIHPTYRNSLVVKKMLESVLDTAKRNNMDIVTYARESTSFKLFHNPRVIKWIENKGFEVSDAELPEFYSEEQFSHQEKYYKFTLKKL